MKGYSAIIISLDNCADRYMTNGYNHKYSAEKLVAKLAQIPGIKGVELSSGPMFNQDNIAWMKEILEKNKLSVASVLPNHSSSPIWRKGAFTAPDAATRRAAVAETCASIDLARQVDCKMVSIWNGQDGYDYPFQVDYNKTFKQMVEGIRQCADYAPDMKIALEYKPKEPRNHSFISNVHSTLLYLMEIDRKNVGLTLDTGHSLIAYENMAEAVATAMHFKKLFHLHFNDNYRLWDDDMIVGSVHTIEFIELFYWMQRSGYNGWISLDQFPYREDGIEAATQSMNWLTALQNAAASITDKEADLVFKKHDAIAANALMRKAIGLGFKA